MGKPKRNIVYAAGVDWQAVLAVRRAARERGLTVSKVIREVVEREFLGKAGAAEEGHEDGGRKHGAVPRDRGPL